VFAEALRHVSEIAIAVSGQLRTECVNEECAVFDFELEVGVENVRFD
jgi:hypothetical protein